MKLHAADIAKLGASAVAAAAKSGVAAPRSASTAAKVAATAAKPASVAAKSAAACAAWKGRDAKMSYHLTPGQNVDGELVSVQLF